MRRLTPDVRDTIPFTCGTRAFLSSTASCALMSTALTDDLPMRRIIHVDMDAFYASVEQRDRPELRGRPVAVGGRRHRAASSPPPATRRGRSACARRSRCRAPSACVRTSSSSRRTSASTARCRSRCSRSSESVTPLVEGLSLDEAYLDVTENAWGEPLGMNVAKRIKARIRETTGLTASAGVAPNKFLAKIASAWRKPDGLTVIAPERVESFLQQLPVDALWGVGPVTAQRLRERGIARLVDVRTADAARPARRPSAACRTGCGKLAARRGRSRGRAEPAREVVIERVHVRDATSTDLDRIREEVAAMARDNAAWLRAARHPRANGHDQGALRRLHDDHAQRHARPDERPGRHRPARGRAAGEDRRRPPAGPAARRGRPQLRRRGEKRRTAGRCRSNSAAAGREGFRTSSRRPGQSMLTRRRTLDSRILHR